MAHIFLSYSRRDSEPAAAIADALCKDGHDVWWDKQISGGSRFAAEIEQALGTADIVIVLWSTEAINSPWVLDEAAEGRDTGRLIPVTLDACKPPLGFRQFQTIAAEGRLEAALNELTQAIAQRSGQKGRTTAAAVETTTAVGDVEAHCLAARRLEEEGRFEDAWRELEAALAIDVASAEANKEAAWLLYVQGRATEAIPHYEAAMVRLKSDYECPAMLISCYHAREQEAEASRVAALTVARAEQSIAAAVRTSLAFASGGRGLAVLGHTDRARKWLRKAINVDPGNLETRYSVGSTLACFVGDAGAAIEVLEPFVEAASNRLQLRLLERDINLATIRETPAFQALLAHARKRVEALQSPRNNDA